MIDTLGERLTPPKVAKLTGIDARVVRKNYKELGGFTLSGRVYFYKNEVINAIQGKIKRSMESAGDGVIANREEKIHPDLLNEKRSDGVGTGDKRQAPPSRKIPIDDKHGILA